MLLNVTELHAKASKEQCVHFETLHTDGKILMTLSYHPQCC